MSKWLQVRLICTAFLALVACTTLESEMAGSWEMTSETLDTGRSGPLEFEVFGSKTLCIEDAGNSNLAPYTATIRVRNASGRPVTVGYTLDPLRSFRAMTVIPQADLDDAMSFTDCCGDAGAPAALAKTLAPREELLISSWTRHHDAIWQREAPGDRVLTDVLPSDYIVRFDLALTYDDGGGPQVVAETFDISLRAIPVVLEEN